MKTIAVDFDGVIHVYSRGYDDGTIYDGPMPGAQEALADMVAKGFKVVIYTVRLNPEVNPPPADGEQRAKMETWLTEHGFAEGKHYHELTGLKPIATVYIDDRAIHFESWAQAQKDMTDFLGKG